LVVIAEFIYCSCWAAPQKNPFSPVFGPVHVLSRQPATAAWSFWTHLNPVVVADGLCELGWPLHLHDEL